MIPYFQVNQLIFGPITIQVWGLLVATGIIIGVNFGRKLCRKLVLSEDVFFDVAIWVLISAMIFARVFHVVFYNFPFFEAHPEEILKFWHGGESSLGSFFGAILAVCLFLYKRKFKLKEFWPYLDIMSMSFWLGLGIGRLGCFIIHDHIGIKSDFFLAIRFPGASRLDLGLIESLLGFALFAVFYKLFDKLIKKRFGLVTIYSWLAYSVVRFFTDFLRAKDIVDSDIRYAHLTPAQWGMVGVILALTALLFSDRIRQVFKKRDNL